jgi:3-oxoacyl-[acyl-carrier protein] reductase/7-alpha-hydroxysteroid dehydrogenase
MLKNKVAIITGGTRGIGLEIAKLFKENNAEVIIFGSKKESIEKAINELNELGLTVDGYYPNLSDYD